MLSKPLPQLGDVREVEALVQQVLAGEPVAQAGTGGLSRVHNLA